MIDEAHLIFTTLGFPNSEKNDRSNATKLGTCIYATGRVNIYTSFIYATAKHTRFTSYLLLFLSELSGAFLYEVTGWMEFGRLYILSGCVFHEYVDYHIYSESLGCGQILSG